MYRSIVNVDSKQGNYRKVTHISDKGYYGRCYVTAYIDVPDSCRLADFGEDYHDSDEIFVWGNYEADACQMGWNSAKEMISELNRRFRQTLKFKPL